MIRHLYYAYAIHCYGNKIQLSNLSCEKITFQDNYWIMAHFLRWKYFILCDKSIKWFQRKSSLGIAKKCSSESRSQFRCRNYKGHFTPHFNFTSVLFTNGKSEFLQCLFVSCQRMQSRGVCVGNRKIIAWFDALVFSFIASLNFRRCSLHSSHA